MSQALLYCIVQKSECMKIEGNVWNYGRPNVAILGEKKYVHTEDYNQCNVIKFLFFPVILCKVKKENLFRQKRNNFVLTLKLIFNVILIIFFKTKKSVACAQS